MNIEELKQAGFTEPEIADYVRPKLAQAGFTPDEIEDYFGATDKVGWFEAIKKPLVSGVGQTYAGISRAMEDLYKLHRKPGEMIVKALGLKELPIEKDPIYKSFKAGKDWGLETSRKQQDITEKLSKLSPLSPKRIIGTGLQATPQVATVLAGAATGGAVPAAVALGTIAYGASAEEAKTEGANEVQQALHGLTSAEIEIITELPVFGAVGQLWRHLKKSGVGNQAAKTFTRKLLKGLGLYGKGTVLESAQELEAYLGGQLSKKLFYKPEAEITLKDALDSAYGGAAMSATLGLVGAPGMAMSLMKQKAIGVPVEKAGEKDLVTQFQEAPLEDLIAIRNTPEGEKYGKQLDQIIVARRQQEAMQREMPPAPGGLRERAAAQPAMEPEAEITGEVFPGEVTEAVSPIARTRAEMRAEHDYLREMDTGDRFRRNVENAQFLKDMGRAFGQMIRLPAEGAEIEGGPQVPEEERVITPREHERLTMPAETFLDRATRALERKGPSPIVTPEEYMGPRREEPRRKEPQIRTAEEEAQAKVEEAPLGKEVVDEVKKLVDASIAAANSGRTALAEQAANKARKNGERLRLADGPEVEKLVDEQLGRLPKEKLASITLTEAKKPEYRKVPRSYKAKEGETLVRIVEPDGKYYGNAILRAKPKEPPITLAQLKEKPSLANYVLKRKKSHEAEVIQYAEELKKPKAKEPWEMTYPEVREEVERLSLTTASEWNNSPVIKELYPDSPLGRPDIASLSRRHKQSIQKAIDERKPVSANVLAEYPDLKKEELQKVEKVEPKAEPKPKSKKEDPRLAAVGAISGGMVRKVEERGYKFGWADDIGPMTEQVYMDIVGAITGGRANTIKERGLSVQKEKKPAEKIKPEKSEESKPKTEKEPWQMTRKEFRKTKKKIIGPQVAKFKSKLLDYNMEHRMAVVQAVSEGKAVPENVLAEYPELTKEKPEAEAEPKAEKPMAEKGQVKPEAKPTEMTTEQQSFIENKVKELGNLEAVQNFYATDSKIDRFAINLAEKLYGKPVREIEPEKPTKVPEPEPTIDKALLKKADNLLKKADALQKQIDDKRNPAIAQQSITARRARIAGGMAKEADRLERIQQAMRGMAEAIEDGTLPKILEGISSKAEIEDILLYEKYPRPFIRGAYIKDVVNALKGVRGLTKERQLVADIALRSGRDYADLYNLEEVAAVEKAIKRRPSGLKWIKDDIARGKRMLKMGIKDQENYDALRNTIKEYTEPPSKEVLEQQRLKKLERNLIGLKIPGFFPTPKPTIEKLLQKVEIKPGMKVLEPSAGKADIADEIRKEHPEADLSVIEYSGTLTPILKAKGYKLVGRDFLEHEGKYDRIIQNPPFEKGQDIDHVRHAYDQLKSGGRLVSIMSEGPFFRNDKKSKNFREWLDSVDGETEKLAPKVFLGKESFRQTGVAGRIVTIDKPTEKIEKAQQLAKTEQDFMVKAFEDAGFTEADLREFQKRAAYVDNFEAKREAALKGQDDYRQWLKDGKVDQAKTRIKDALKDQRGSFSMKQANGPAVYEDLITMGKHFMGQGYTKFADFTKQFKATLGNVWAKIRHIAQRIFKDAKKILANERGGIAVEKGKPETPYGEKPLSPTAQKLLDEIKRAEREKASPERKKEASRIIEDVKAIGRGLDPRKTGLGQFAESIFKSPEWYENKAQKEAVHIAIDRSSLFHENFNDFNEVDDIDSPFDTVTDALVALGRKGGIGKVAFLMGKRSKQYRQLEDLLDEADVSNKVWTKEDLEKRNIDSDVIHVWSLLRASFDKQLDAMQKPMRDIIDEIEEKAALTGKEPVYPDFGSYIDEDGKRRPLNLKEALAMMGQYKGSYAPRIRERGNWVVKGTLGVSGHYARHHKRSKVAAELLANKLRRGGYRDVTVSEKEQLLEETFQMIRVMETGAAIERAAKTGESMQGYDADIRMAFVQDALTAAADLIKSRGARSAMIRRRKGGVVSGYFTDPIERFVRYTSNNSAGMAKAETAHKLFRVLFGEYEKGKKVGGVDQAKEPRVHRALSNYIQEQLRNAERADRVIGLAKSVATFKYLGFNPRSILVNVTSLMTTAPVAIQQYAMGGKGSFARVNATILKASKDYPKVMVGKELSNKDEQAFMNEQLRKGYTDPQYTREAVGHIQGAYGTAWSKAMGASMWAFGKSEEWVRGTTMLAAYRLARKKGLSHEQASIKAKQASDRAHGIYGKETMPSWAQGTGIAARIGQMSYVYAKFPHNALQMFYDVGVKKRNVKGLIYALAAPAVLSGAAAFPLKDVIVALANAMLRALGDDRDAEKMVYDTIRDRLGEKAEARARLGVLGELGVDISGSLAMGPGEIPTTLWDLTGAIGGVAKDIQQATHFAMIGQPGRAAEKLMPNIASNVLRAIRELKGATTRTGQRIWDEKGYPLTPTTGETVARGFGFRSARQAQIAQRKWEGGREQRRFDERRKKIYEQLRAWSLNPDDYDELQSIYDEIYKYNTMAMKAGTTSLITRSSIRNQFKRMGAPTAKQRRLLAD